MPEDEKFWNPYRLIRIRPEMKRKKPVTDEKFIGISGFIHCTLENLTPLFIGGNRNYKQQFLTSQGKSIIPGSSLKGMLRNFQAEAAAETAFDLEKRGKLGELDGAEQIIEGLAGH